MMSLFQEHQTETSQIRIAKGDVLGAHIKFPWHVDSYLLMCNRIYLRDYTYIPTNGKFYSPGRFIVTFDVLNYK